MKYKNVADVLPEHLIGQLQDFVQGEYLYVPAKKGQRKKWGERSGCRKEIDSRNKKIIEAYKSGLTIEELADLFFLSTYAIKKVLYKNLTP